MCTHTSCFSRLVLNYHDITLLKPNPTIFTKSSSNWSRPQTGYRSTYASSKAPNALCLCISNSLQHSPVYLSRYSLSQHNDPWGCNTICHMEPTAIMVHQHRHVYFKSFCLTFPSLQLLLCILINKHVHINLQYIWNKGVIRDDVV
jgi:hypothetical protein